MARGFGVGGIAQQAEHPACAVLGEAMQVEGFAIGGRVVDFEIPGVDDCAGWGANGQAETIGQRVGVADELDGKGAPELNHLARAHRFELGAIGNVGLLELALQQR